MKHKFVDYIPVKEDMEDNTLYIAMDSGTVIHKCDCGCGHEVVTPLSPTDWKLTYDGETISLDPSIGNWSLPCQSHYWIRKSKVVYAGNWSKSEIESGRTYDKDNKKQHYSNKSKASQHLMTSKNKSKIWIEIITFFKEIFKIK